MCALGAAWSDSPQTWYQALSPWTALPFQVRQAPSVFPESLLVPTGDGHAAFIVACAWKSYRLLAAALEVEACRLGGHLGKARKFISFFREGLSLGLLCAQSLTFSEGPRAPQGSHRFGHCVTGLRPRANTGVLRPATGTVVSRCLRHAETERAGFCEHGTFTASDSSAKW